MKKIVSLILFIILPLTLIAGDDFEDFKVDYTEQKTEKSEVDAKKNETNNKKIQGSFNSYFLDVFDNSNIGCQYNRLQLEFTDNYGDLFFYIKTNARYSTMFNDNRKTENLRLDLVEAHIDYTKYISNLEINMRLGQQIVNWGKADEVRPTDILSPQDLSLLVLEDRIDRKLGRFAGKFSFGYENIKIETILLPIHRETELPLDKNSMFLPKNIEKLINLGFTIEDTKLPKEKLSNTDIAIKMYLNILGTDMSLCYYDGYDPTPFTELDMTNKKINLFLNKIRFYGFDFEKTLGSFVIRGEGAYFTKGMLFKYNISNKEKDYIDLTFGIDKTDLFIPNLYLNLQYNLNYIKDYEDNMLSRYGTKIKEYNHSGIYTLSYEFGNLKYKIELKGNYSFTNKDGIVSPTFQVKIGPQTIIILGGVLFFGDEDTYLGQYNKNDYGYIKLEHLF